MPAHARSDLLTAECFQKVRTIRDWMGTADALNLEMYYGCQPPTNVFAYAAALTAGNLVRVALVEFRRVDGHFYSAFHEGDRATAAKWLRDQGIPVLRIGTRQPADSSPIFHNRNFLGDTNE